MPREFVPISMAGFQEKMQLVLDELDDFSFREWIESDAKLKKDLGKVEWDWENFETAGCSWAKGLGYQQVGELCFLGCHAGGDWENPVYFIIYWAARCRGARPSLGIRPKGLRGFPFWLDR